MGGDCKECPLCKFAAETLPDTYREVISVLVIHGPMCGYDISKRTARSISGISRATRKLVKWGMIYLDHVEPSIKNCPLGKKIYAVTPLGHGVLYQRGLRYLDGGDK